MRSTAKAALSWLTSIGLVMFSLMASGVVARADDMPQAQYQAAMTEIFVANYHAIPLIRLNPVFPGDVIELQNETPFSRHGQCYPGIKVGNYTEIGNYEGSQSIAISGNMDIGGVVLDKAIANLGANGRVSLQRVAGVAVNPLSDESWSMMDLLNTRCPIVADIMSGRHRGLALVQEVLHGQVDYTIVLRGGWPNSNSAISGKSA